MPYCGMLCRFASIGDIITCSVKKAGKGKVTQASTRLACLLGASLGALGFFDSRFRFSSGQLPLGLPRTAPWQGDLVWQPAVLPNGCCHDRSNSSVPSCIRVVCPAVSELGGKDPTDKIVHLVVLRCAAGSGGQGSDCGDQEADTEEGRQVSRGMMAPAVQSSSRGQW